MATAQGATPLDHPTPLTQSQHLSPSYQLGALEARLELVAQSLRDGDLGAAYRLAAPDGDDAREVVARDQTWTLAGFDQISTTPVPSDPEECPRVDLYGPRGRKLSLYFIGLEEVESLVEALQAVAAPMRERREQLKNAVGYVCTLHSRDEYYCTSCRTVEDAEGESMEALEADARGVICSECERVLRGWGEWTS